ncbi:hypothetical protein D9M71_695020 [compost metagenome]
MQLPNRSQRPGIAEQKQIPHQLLEHTRFARIQADKIQVALFAQFVQRLLFQHGTDFAGFPMQDAQVGMGPIQPCVD